VNMFRWLLVIILQMRRNLVGIAFLLAISAPSASAQTDAPPPDSPEMRYYDFWPGAWARIVNGRIDRNDIAFRVKRGVHAAAFEEEWRQVDEKGVVRLSRAIRAWDQVASRWMFVWVSGNALFQVWEGRKYGDRWYIVREFEVGGRRFLSRQAWWSEGPDRVARVLERSFDEGKTWEVRYRDEYARVSAEALPHKPGENR
jgi:hypothetical protein